jgi:hypothetical protein
MEKAEPRTGFCFLVKELQINGAGRLDHHGERVEDLDALALVLAEKGSKGCVVFWVGTGRRVRSERGAEIGNGACRGALSVGAWEQLSRFHTIERARRGERGWVGRPASGLSLVMGGEEGWFKFFLPSLGNTDG